MGREIDALVGDYRLIRIIGSGAFGEVFQAEHVITRRVEAIKFLAPGTAADAEAEQALLREIEIQASLQHPNIAAVHNACRTPEGLALVMELVDGEPLSSKLERGGISLRDGGRYVLQTLDALAYAHEHRVVHRDVKPANVVVAADGSVKLTDFGLAQPLGDGQACGSGTLAGSPYYISPEQVVGLSPADARSDCYSVGIILYEIATGCRPFQGENAFAVLLQHREAVPVAPIRVRPEIGAGLNAVILKAIEKDPARRFQSAGEFRTALELALANSPAMLASGPARVRRHGRWLAAAAVAGLAATAALLAPVRRHPVPIHPPPANTRAAPQLPVPAVVPSSPVPASSATPDPVVTAPAPALLSSTNASRAAGQRRSARKKRAPVGPQPDAALTPIVIQPEPTPDTEAAGAIAPPAAAEAVPATKPAEAEPQPAGEAGHDAPPPPPAKRRSLLRRAFGHIVHPWSGKSKLAPPQPANGQPEEPQP